MNWISKSRDEKVAEARMRAYVSKWIDQLIDLKMENQVSIGKEIRRITVGEHSDFQQLETISLL